MNWNDDQARYALAVGVLDNEPDTHRILGDFLEESGETGLAQWARSKKNRRKRLDIALMMLEPQLTIELCVKFLRHLTEQLSPPYHFSDVDRCLTYLSHWADDLSIEPDLQRVVGFLLTLGPYGCLMGGEFDRPPTAQTWNLGVALKAMANCAMMAARWSRESNLLQKRHLRNETAQQSRTVAKFCREELCYHVRVFDKREKKIYSRYNRWYHRHSSTMAGHEMTWQVQVTRQLLTAAN